MRIVVQQLNKISVFTAIETDRRHLFIEKTSSNHQENGHLLKPMDAIYLPKNHRQIAGSREAGLGLHFSSPLFSGD